MIDLIKAGFIHAPLKLQKKYKGMILEAEIQEDGQVVFDGAPYKLPSLASGMARKSIIGAPPGRKFPHTNGWIFWNYYDMEIGALVEIDRPRQQYLKQVRETAQRPKKMNTIRLLSQPTKKGSMKPSWVRTAGTPFEWQAR